MTGQLRSPSSPGCWETGPQQQSPSPKAATARATLGSPFHQTREKLTQTEKSKALPTVYQRQGGTARHGRRAPPPPRDLMRERSATWWQARRRLLPTGMPSAHRARSPWSPAPPALPGLQAGPRSQSCKGPFLRSIGSGSGHHPPRFWTTEVPEPACHVLPPPLPRGSPTLCDQGW